MGQTRAAAVTTGGWVAGTNGRRWRTTWQRALLSPASGPHGQEDSAFRGTVLFLPPLGDELNHTRPLMAAAARALAATGWTVQCTDPYGTGDSDGDFADASLANWAEDFAADAAEAATRGPWTLWAARQGSLLLPALWQALQRRGVPLPLGLASWNPVVQGSAVVTQWLRLAALGSAGSLVGKGVESLRRQLAAGRPVDCAGYLLSAALANELETVPQLPCPVVAREWDAVASGARRFWLPAETDTDTTLVPPLVEWLNSLVPESDSAQRQCANTYGLMNDSEGAGKYPKSGEAEATPPWLLELPVGGSARCGVLFVVGGAQYRVGAHRQFVRWSRRFNAAGYATCRFDRAGTGDAPGRRAALVDCGAERRATLVSAVATTGVRRWVVCGVCDGATLALLHLVNHPAVAGLVALNPWTPVAAAAQSQALVREYYGRQWFSSAFWGRLLRGEVNVAAALREWWQHRKVARGTSERSNVDLSTREWGSAMPGLDTAEGGLSKALLTKAMACAVPVLWGLSGNDRTAAEFRAMVAGSEPWQAVLGRAEATRLELPEADHTLSKTTDHEQFGEAVLAWLTRVL